MVVDVSGKLRRGLGLLRILLCSRIDRCHRAAVCCEVKGGACEIVSGDENASVSRGMDFACDGAVGSHAPVFRARQFLELLPPLELFFSSRRVRWNSSSLSNDLVHFGYEEQLVHGKLGIRPKRGDGLVSNFEKSRSRDRFLVSVDLVLNVQIVLVL